MKLNPNCSEEVFRLTGDLESVKKEILKMIDIVEIEYKTDGITSEEWNKIFNDKRKEIKKVKSIEEFGEIIISFTCNYETYFNPDYGDDDSLWVATCNNHDWDGINKINENDERYHEVAGYTYYLIKLKGRNWLYLKKKYDDDISKYPNEIILETINGNALSKRQLKRYSFTSNDRIDIKVRFNRRKNKYHIIDDKNDRFIEMREVVDKKKLQMINDRILVSKI